MISNSEIIHVVDPDKYAMNVSINELSYVLFLSYLIVFTILNTLLTLPVFLLGGTGAWKILKEMLNSARCYRREMMRAVT
jgi:hypothetical protein